MERPGLCSVCGGVANPAHTCRLCGAIVCPAHYNAEYGVCTNCLSKIKR
jgi:hypothetical protein